MSNFRDNGVLLDARRNRMRKIAVELLVACGGLLFVLPVVLMLITAFKPDAEIIHFRGILPQHPTTQNFRDILFNPEEIPVARWFANSVFISSSVTLLVLTVDSLAAYGLARLELPGKKWLFPFIVATLMVPGQILLVPVYLILNQLGWLDTPLALIVPAGAGAFGVFLLHQFFLSIPKNLEEAATLDGCTRFGIYWRVVLPLSKPALATLGIFCFIGSWNDFHRAAGFPRLGRQVHPARRHRPVPNLLLRRIRAHPGGKRTLHHSRRYRLLALPAPHRQRHGNDRLEGLTARYRCSGIRVFRCLVMGFFSFFLLFSFSPFLPFHFPVCLGLCQNE